MGVEPNFYLTRCFAFSSYQTNNTDTYRNHPTPEKSTKLGSGVPPEPNANPIFRPSRPNHVYTDIQPLHSQYPHPCPQTHPAWYHGCRTTKRHRDKLKQSSLNTAAVTVSRRRPSNKYL
jgi:hypothetical protein